MRSYSASCRSPCDGSFCHCCFIAGTDKCVCDYQNGIFLHCEFALLAVDLPHLPCAGQREDRQLRVGLQQQTRNTDDRDRLAITHKEEP